jgi:PAS domain S-box-containing protein
MTDSAQGKAANPIFAGGGEMGELMRSLDWSQTLLGAVENWTQSLRSTLSICLNSRFPIAIYWGQDCLLLYNDAWRPIVGDKHPWALGRPAREVWSEIWDDIGPELASVLATGEGTFHKDDLLAMHRFGYTEECFFEYTFNPIQSEAGGIGGVFNVVSETTYRVLNDRRARLLRELASRTGTAKTVEEACAGMVETLKSDPADIPFALLYLVNSESKSAHLCSTTESGTALTSEDNPISPAVIDLTMADRDAWSIASVVQTAHVQTITDLTTRFGTIPGSPWAEPPEEAMVLPISVPGQGKVIGVLVTVASPRRRLDDQYRDFFNQVVRQIELVIANARTYEEERKRAEALAELDRAKTLFFSNVSHEFRTPLTLMLSPLEELLTSLDEQLQPAQREQLQLIQRNGLRLQKLVNTLLDFSRIEAGRVQASYKPTDLASYTAELASVFRSLIERAGMKLVIDCQPLAQPVYIDCEMWEKIVLNLMSNAFKFTFTGSIAVRLQAVGDLVQLSVADTGIGIPEAELPRLFERFHRVNAARSRTYEGSGIGLALVQELIKLHGGTIDVTSQVDQGTTFTIAIPFGTVHLPPDRIQSPQTLSSSAIGTISFFEEAARWLPEESAELSLEASIQNSTFKTQTFQAARILLADDNADMRDYVKRLLGQRYEVEAVTDGMAALDKIHCALPDLVLTDVMMPGLDGFGLLKALRSNPKTQQIPVILLSARAGEEARVEGLEAGADDYVTKPFSARELLARVEATLKLAQLRQEAQEREYALRTEAEAVRVRLESVLASINEQFIVLDHQWRYTFVNQQVMAVTGKRQEELLGHCIWKVFPDLDNTPFASAVRCAVAEQTFVRVELFYPPLQRWFENQIYPFTEGVTILVTDISDRKQAEEVLRRAATLDAFRVSLADALRSLADPVEIQATASRMLGQYLGANRVAYFEVRGANYVVERDYVNGSEPLAGGYSIDSFGPKLLAAYRSGRTVSASDVQADLNLSLEQRSAYAAIQVSAYLGIPLVKEGEFVAGLAVHTIESRDWTPNEVALAEEVAERTWAAVERARAESALLQREMQFRQLADAIPQQVWITDAQGNTQYVNQQWIAYTGLTLEQTQDIRYATEVIHPSDFAITRELWRTALITGTSYQAEFRLKCQADDTYRWFLSRAIGIRDEQGQIVQWFGTSTDIEEFRRAQAAQKYLLQQEQIAREAAENANRIKDEFLAVLSHELRSPLNPILGWSKLLQQGKLNAEKTVTALATIERNAQLQVQLIDDLLDISRILRGKLSLTMIPVDLCSVICAALETVRLATEAKSIQIRTAVVPGTCFVTGDAGRLQQVVWNLLSNAIKFTPANGRVTVTLSSTDSHAKIQVSDTGKGINPDFLPYVFEHFRQEDGTTTRKFGGLGLGLAIVRQIVELHGGTVVVDSPGEGQGATFTIQIPVAARFTALPAVEPPSSSTGDLSGVRILVVDDEADSREFVAFALEQAGAVVTKVASGIEALQVFSQAVPDIMVSDIGMPEMDGYMLMCQIRGLSLEQGGQIPAIALTAYAGELDRQQASAAGFQHHIAKPLDLEMLVSTVAKLVLSA